MSSKPPRPPADATQRFSSRVDNYVRYRPSYPREMLDLLAKRCGLTPVHVIADIGSGTGILSKLFLDRGNEVFAVEPNADMRAAGQRLLADYANFHSVAGRAEATGLADASVDFITAGQAFHWFDLEPTRQEWTRILKPDGWVMLVWNERRQGASPFMQGFTTLLEAYVVDYRQVEHRRITDAMIQAFYGGEAIHNASFDNQQIFDFEGLKGRLLSSSYAPEPGHPQYEAMIAALQTLFDENEEAGVVTFAYETSVTFGHLERDAVSGS